MLLLGYPENFEKENVQGIHGAFSEALHQKKRIA